MLFGPRVRVSDILEVMASDGQFPDVDAPVAVLSDADSPVYKEICDNFVHKFMTEVSAPHPYCWRLCNEVS